MGLAYERICMAHLPQIKRALRIDGISTLCYSWRSKTSKPAAQIDIIIERADRIVNVCEVKYSQDKYELDKEEYEKINRRRMAFINETGLRHASWLTMITTEGLSKGMYSDMTLVIPVPPVSNEASQKRSTSWMWLSFSRMSLRRMPLPLP